MYFYDFLTIFTIFCNFFQEDFFDFITRFQGKRMDDQRCSLTVPSTKGKYFFLFLTVFDCELRSGPSMRVFLQKVNIIFFVCDRELIFLRSCMTIFDRELRNGPS